MQPLQEIEQLFKLRQEYKESRVSSEQRPEREPESVKEEAARIAELINKIKN